MKTTTQELKQYMTRLFQLSNNETWECETLEEAAENILSKRFINDSPLAHLILETYTYYNNELHELSIYPFLMYSNNQLISIGYLDHFDMDFLYLTDTKNTIIDERHLLKEGGNNHE
ncbi:SAUGI family uracil-DNA glycosylase inhibitor [Staphylococcus aureus]